MEHQGATSRVGSNVQPSYTWLVYFHRNGNWQAFPRPGPSTTTQGPGVVVVGVVLVFAIVCCVVVVVMVVMVVEVVLVVVTTFLFVQTTLQSNP